MANDIQFKIEGIESLIAKLSGISYDLRKKGGRAALRKAAQVVQKAAQDNAERYINDPKTRESIAANIVLRWSSRLHKRTGNLGFRVGVLGGAKRVAKAVGEFTGKGKDNPGGDTWYWRLQEFGTQNHKAKPFMRPALAGNQAAATNTFITVYSKSIDRAIKRASKSGARTSRGH